MNNRIENKDLCKKCGGRCCKECGCVYMATDLENLKLEYLESVLKEGRISIVAHLDFSYNANGKPFASPTLYLRERNMNRDIVDLVSYASRCASLKDFGCPYDLEHRPTGGAALIPSYPNNCQASIEASDILKTWEPHQNVLRKLVKRITGLSVEEKLRQDIENLFYKMYSKKLEPFDSVPSSIRYILALDSFELVYKNESEKAKERLAKETPFALIRKPNQ